jgi:hypothetical protein
MAKKWGTGIYVKSLFKLLAYLGVRQTEVWQYLGMQKPQISLWANGRKAMPLRYRERFEQFVWQALQRKYAAYDDAIKQELGPAGWTVVIDRQGQVVVRPPAPEVPPAVRAFVAFHVKVHELLHEWEVELDPAPQCREVQDVCRQLGPYGLMDDDKLQATFLDSTQRAQVLALFERGVERLRDLDQLDPRPDVEVLRSALQPRRQETATPPATRQASARR